MTPASNLRLAFSSLEISKPSRHPGLSQIVRMTVVPTRTTVLGDLGLSFFICEMGNSLQCSLKSIGNSHPPRPQFPQLYHEEMELKDHLNSSKSDPQEILTPQEESTTIQTMNKNLAVIRDAKSPRAGRAQVSQKHFLWMCSRRSTRAQRLGSCGSLGLSGVRICTAHTLWEVLKHIQV